ncbi:MULTISPECIES: hypothetical protein [unclassified Nocardioides]|uniref:hypothetical protein n=1 Tax=unclassified Nocardioides TaxID=2615069 RepID=UPI00005715DC|nr:MULTISPECIES: hypothetical protein [unclassified Nocardioides]ABL84075.1 hypothetical protein Noca_4580 [Nocardioides sp. JS614]
MAERRTEVRVADLLALRSYDGPADERSAVVRVLVESAPGALALVPRPEWPPLTSLRSRRAEGGWLVVARFARPVAVAEVVSELGRQAVWPVVVAVREDPARLDERLFNPIGFRSAWERGVVALGSAPLTPSLVAELRDAQGVAVGPDADPRTVAGLAMAGVPLTGAGFDEVDLDDPLAREEHSLVLRRAALDAHGSIDWQRPVSVLLATRRPEQLDFALAQVARQRGVAALQLVLAPHGFTVDEAWVRAAVGPAVDVRLAPASADTIFGDVLHAAAGVADGDVLLKMDDDDWYAPDVVTDLLRARAYSGAQLVGMPAEFHYVAPRDLTVKRGHPTELYARFVAGGTMLVDRPVLREVGGFRSVRRYVDAQLLTAVTAAGGAIYRTHGLGYVLRRNESGHTWEVDLDYLLDPSRVERSWTGLTPSRLMEL